MAKLYILVGISGSGKSTYAYNVLCKSDIGKVNIVSSDNIREELFGAATYQGNHALVFQTANERVHASLKNGYDVIFDATNLSKKSRRAVLNAVKNIPDVQTQCHVILCTPEQAMKNQMTRDRKVPYKVIIKQMSGFCLPDETAEGLTCPTVYYNPFCDKTYLDNAVKRLYSVEQISQWHQENTGEHTDMVVQKMKEFLTSVDTDNEIMLEAARYHDIGKYFCKMHNDTGWHFYGHANVSAYLYLCGTQHDNVLSPVTKRITELILLHDEPCHKYFDAGRIEATYGKEFLEQLLLLRKADEAGSIRV